MATITPNFLDPNYQTLIENNLKNTSNASNLAGTISSVMVDKESELVRLYSKFGNTTDANERKNIEAEISTQDLEYKRISRVVEMFNQMMKNTHEMMMRIINNLRLS